MGAEGQVPGHAGSRAEAGGHRQKCPVQAETSRPGGFLEEGPHFGQGKVWRSQRRVLGGRERLCGWSLSSGRGKA